MMSSLWCKFLVQLPGATRAGLGLILIPDPDYIELPSLICQNQLVLMPVPVHVPVPVLLQAMQKLLVLLRLTLALVLLQLRLLWFFLVFVSCSLPEVLQGMLFVLFLLAFC